MRELDAEILRFAQDDRLKFNPCRSKDRRYSEEQRMGVGENSGTGSSKGNNAGRRPAVREAGARGVRQKTTLC